jgi:hypothetical protein
MANAIRIKRSISTNTPSSLEQGELAYSESASPNGIGELFIGITGSSLEKIGGASALYDEDFTSNGFMRRTAAGVYAISAQVDLASQVTGNLPVANLNSGTSASASTFWRGDGTWAAPAGSGDVSFDAGIAPADNALVRFSGTSGTLIQESQIIVDDTDNVSGLGTLNTHTIPGGTSTFALLTDITNMVETTDTDASSWSFVVDEDNMSSDSALLVPTQQSVKAYVDAVAASEMTYKGGYNAATNTPDLDTTPVATSIGDMYTVTVAGTFFTAVVEAGDVIIAQQDSPTLETHWTIVNTNVGSVVPDARILTAGIGLTGGGDLTADRTFDMDVLGLTTEAAVDGAADFFPYYDAAVGHRKVLLNDMLDGGTF